MGDDLAGISQQGVEHASLAEAPALHNLLDFFEHRGPPVALIQRGRAVSEEFMQDLDAAGHRAFKSLFRTTSTASGREKVFTAVDGLSSNERSREDQTALLNILSSFLARPDGEFGEWEPSIVAPAYVPAINTRKTENQSGQNWLQPHCACAIDADLTTIFMSTDLGFRDLFVVAQMALAQAFILQASDLGVELNEGEALVALSEALGCDPNEHVSDSVFSATKIGCAGQTKPGIMTAAHVDT